MSRRAALPQFPFGGDVSPFIRCAAALLLMGFITAGVPKISYCDLYGTDHNRDFQPAINCFLLLLHSLRDEQKSLPRSRQSLLMDRRTLVHSDVIKSLDQLTR
jgi:hypothetical protein